MVQPCCIQLGKLLQGLRNEGQVWINFGLFSERYSGQPSLFGQDSTDSRMVESELMRNLSLAPAFSMKQTNDLCSNLWGDSHRVSLACETSCRRARTQGAQKARTLGDTGRSEFPEPEFD
jgi:hypothetical protein